MVNPAIIDREFLAELRELMGADLKALLSAFARDSARQFELLRRAIDQADGEALRRVAHSMKGAAASVAAPALSTQLLLLEQRGREERLDGADEALAIAERRFRQWRAEAEAWVGAPLQ